MGWRDRERVLAFAKALWDKAYAARYSDPVRCRALLCKSYGLMRARHLGPEAVYAVSPVYYAEIFGGERRV